LVIVDDIALPLRNNPPAPKRSAGGHNGLSDIQAALTNLAAADGKAGMDYNRLRIGIDAPGRVPQKKITCSNLSPRNKNR